MEATTDASRRRRHDASTQGAGSRSRRERRRLRLFHQIAWITVAVLCLSAAGVLFGARYFDAGARMPMQSVIKDMPLPERSIASQDGSTGVIPSSALDASGAPVEVEVPTVIGKPVRVAEALISAAGLTVQTHVSDVVVPGRSADEVVEQWPEGGALLQLGSAVAVTYQPQATMKAAGERFVVVIDAGHQQKPNLGLEPMGPGSSVTKVKVSGGATGVSTGIPEYRLTLSIAQKLRDRLAAKGIKVVMVRTKNDVNIANSRRALIGNEAKADLVVRIHLDSNNDQTIRGVSALFPSGNAWVRPISARSKRAATVVLGQLVAKTGVPNRGVVGRSDMSGFNYSTRPTIFVQCGYLSNATEDALVATPSYQGTIAEGLAVGVLEYLKGD